MPRSPSPSKNLFPLLGSHVPTSGGVATAIERAVRIGGTAMQIFVKNNMQWFAKPLSATEATAFTEHPLRNHLGVVVAHAGYLINLGVEGTENHERSLRSLSDEMLRCEQLGIRSLVLHPGSHLGSGVETGISCVIRNLNRLHARHPKFQVRITLETTAGQGACLGSRFEEIAEILDRVEESNRVDVCLDTAHVFAAGYDLSKPRGAGKTFDEFNRVIGIKRLSVLHLNDSKAALGSRVDRHDNLGKGRIGLDAFRWIMRSKELSRVPKILETPKGKDLVEDVEAMSLLRGFLSRRRTMRAVG